MTKYILILIAIVGIYQSAEAQVFAHLVNDPSPGCVTCPDCSNHGFEITATCSPVDDLLISEGVCMSNPCFSELDVTTIDFTPISCNEIEAGLSIKRRLRVFAFQDNGLGGEANIGVDIRLNDDGFIGGVENFTIQNMSTCSPIVTGDVGTIPFTSGDEIEITYAPVTAGTHAAHFSINEGSGCPRIITLNATSKAASSKSFVLALDRSGSMRAEIGSPTDRKIDRLVTASEMFLDLLVLDGGTHEFGLVAYNNTTSLYNTSLSDLSFVGDAKTNFINATNPGDPIHPQGATGIGGAITEAMGLLNGGDPGECAPPNPAFPPDNKVIVLLTDGKENRPPFINPLSSPSLTEACIDQATIYTIGFGETGDFNEMLLQDLPTRSEFDCIPGTGYFHVNTDLSDPMDMDDLNEAYAKIFFANFDYSEIIDPTVLVNIADGVEKLLFTANVTSSDKKAIFITYDDPRKNRLYKLKLLTPDGDEVIDGNFGSNLIGKVIEGDGYTLYKVDFKNSADSSYVGRWDLKIIPEPKLVLRLKERRRMDSLFVSIGFNASVLSNLNMELFALPVGSSSQTGQTTSFTSFQPSNQDQEILNVNQLPGSEILIALNGTESGLPAKIVNINSYVRVPNGTRYPVEVGQDPNGGYKGKFTNTYQIGTYKVFVRATIENSRGEITTRESTKYVALGKPDAPNRAEPCISCWVFKILIVVSILLLIFIIIMVMRRRV